MFEYTTSRFKNTFWDQSEKGRGGWGEGGRRGVFFFSNEIMSAEESRVQSSFAKTVRQIVVKEWPVSRH